MPVGNASDGIGLYAGQIMFSANFNFQHIDWAHDPIESESYEHFGHLNSSLFLPSLTLGISDYWNVSFQQAFVVRKMDWGPHEESNHHRTESSLDDFINATGGILGDSKLKFKYLLNNVGMQAGNRIFLGFGVSIPSENTLTSDPFFLEEAATNQSGEVNWGEDGHEHRHFSLSDGNYKNIYEIQFFNKRRKNPVFWGLKFEATIPFKSSNYGYKAGNTYNLSISSLFKPPKKIKDKGLIGISSGLFFLHTGKGYWNGFLDPSSNTTMVIPSLGSIWKINDNSISINIQKPFLVDGLGMGSENTLNNNFDALELSIGYRYTLDYVIPWLYY